MSLILRQWQPIGDDEIMTNTLWQWPSDRQWQWQSDDCNEQLQSVGVIGPIGSICVSCQALLAQVTLGQSHFLSAGGFNLEHSVIFGDDGGQNGDDDDDRSSRAWNTWFWMWKRIAQGKVKTDLMCVTFKFYHGEVHDAHHVRVGLVRDWSTFSNTGFH